MRTAIVVAVMILGLAMAGPSHAQARTPMGGGSTASQLNSGGGGGAGGGFGGAGHSFRGLAAMHYANPSAQGNAEDFQVTSYVPYEQALKMGEATRAQQTKTLGEIAAEYRARKAQRHE